MKDTIIKGTGNSRSIKSVSNFLTLYPNYESFAQALVTGTLPIDLGALNAAGVTTMGTGLNKASLLKDATAALYGLSATAVPDDVLAKIATGINGGWSLLTEWKTAGTYTWTVPNLFGGKAYEIGVMVIGAGGAGSAWSGNVTNGINRGLGGWSGMSVCFLKTVTPGQSIACVVGAGGAKVSAKGTQTSGLNGGASAFAGISVVGGSGGAVTGAGAQPPSTKAQSVPFGGEVSELRVSNSLSYYSCVSAACFNPFECKRILGAGGTTNAGSAGIDPVTGKGGGVSAHQISANATAANATESGCGGGGAYVQTATYTATSGAGADGAVKLYIRRAA